jgi:hypothetical protein
MAGVPEEVGVVINKELLRRLAEEVRRGDAEKVGRVLAWLLEARDRVPRHLEHSVLEPPRLGYLHVHAGGGVVGIALAPLPARHRVAIFREVRRRVPAACKAEYMWAVFVYRAGELPAEHLLAASCCHSLLALAPTSPSEPFWRGADAVVDAVAWGRLWGSLGRGERREAYSALAATALGAAQVVQGARRDSGIVAFVLPSSTARQLLKDFDELGVEYYSPTKVGRAKDQRYYTYVAVRGGALARLKESPR